VKVLRFHFQKFQFSLRALLASIIVVSLELSWITHERQRVEREHYAVKSLESMGGSFLFHTENPRHWILRPAFLGDEGYGNARSLVLVERAIGPSQLAPIGNLARLEYVDVSKTNITDADLVHFKGLRQLDYLDLSGTAITDAGIKHLQPLSRLRRLDLSGTKVTDGGLKHLQCLTRLRELGLCNTAITNAGLANIQYLDKLRYLCSGTTSSAEGHNLSRIQQVFSLVKGLLFQAFSLTWRRIRACPDLAGS
jgi:Leucine rich repeat